MEPPGSIAHALVGEPVTGSPQHALDAAKMTQRACVAVLPIDLILSIWARHIGHTAFAIFHQACR
jgi:hypothetical protein